MQEQNAMYEHKADGEAIEQIGRVLHDLCQPLTTLQCRLEIAGLVGTAEAYREAVSLGLMECARLVEGVHSMRGILRSNEHNEILKTGRTE